MNREIKFRVWDKTTKKMYEVYSINFENKDLWLKLDDNKIIGANFFEVELMQYSGLKDKNGKEICEGDILERYGYWSIRIERDKGCLMVRDLEEVRYNNLILNVPICNFESINDWKVIGNIYENPELLRSED